MLTLKKATKNIAIFFRDDPITKYVYWWILVLREGILTDLWKFTGTKYIF